MFIVNDTRNAIITMRRTKFISAVSHRQRDIIIVFEFDFIRKCSAEKSPFVEICFEGRDMTLNVLIDLILRSLIIGVYDWIINSVINSFINIVDNRCGNHSTLQQHNSCECGKHFRYIFHRITPVLNIFCDLQDFFFSPACDFRNQRHWIICS